MQKYGAHFLGTPNAIRQKEEQVIEIRSGWGNMVYMYGEMGWWQNFYDFMTQ